MNRHRNLSFYIETLLLTLFLLLALAVLMQVFGAAQRMGENARKKTDAALILQNVTAQWAAGNEPLHTAALLAAEQAKAQTVRLTYDAAGTCTEEGDYTVTAVFDAKATEAGTLVYGTFTVSLKTAQPEEIAAVETALYYPSVQEGEAP